MRELSLIVPAPPLWLIILCDAVVCLLIVTALLILVYMKSRPFCVEPTSRDLQEADNFQPRKGSVGRVISQPRSAASIKQGFSFKDHGDDIGTDMSEEKGPSKKEESKTAVPFNATTAVKVVEPGMLRTRGSTNTENLYEVVRSDAAGKPVMVSQRMYACEFTQNHRLRGLLVLSPTVVHCARTSCPRRWCLIERTLLHNPNTSELFTVKNNNNNQAFIN